MRKMKVIYKDPKETGEEVAQDAIGPTASPEENAGGVEAPASEAEQA